MLVYYTSEEGAEKKNTHNTGEQGACTHTRTHHSKGQSGNAITSNHIDATPTDCATLV